MSKRSGESVGGGEGAKKQKTGGDGQTVPSMNAYTEATKHRNFKLVIEDESLFVCPHILASMSPYFDTLCLGNFKEGKEGEAEMKDVKLGDVIEMLDVLGMDYAKDRKEIDASNCVAMVKLASMWQIDILMRRCVVYIENKFPQLSSTFANTLELLVACEEAQVSVVALKHVASRLASFGTSILIDQQVFNRIKGAALCSAIFLAANGHKTYKAAVTSVPPSACSHQMQYFDDYVYDMADYKCEVSGCRQYVTYRCSLCSVFRCLGHAAGVGCPKTVESRDPEGSSVNVEMDDRFFGAKQK